MKPTRREHVLTTALRVGLTILLLASSSAIAFRGSYDDPFRWYSGSAALLYVVLPTCLGFATIQWLVLTLVRLRQRRWPLAEGGVHIGIAPCSVWMSFVSVQAYVAEFDGCEAPWALRTFDPDPVRDTLRKSEGRVTTCFVYALRRDLTRGGAVRVRWRIERGDVHDATLVSDSFGDAELARCAVDAVGRIQFPDDLTVASVEHTFSVP